MVEHLHVVPEKPQGPSPWWLKGGAIFIGILGFSSLIGAISLIISGIFMNTMMDDINAEEVCQDDPDPDCEVFIESITEISQMPLWDIGAAFSALLFILSIPTAFLMWNAEDRDIALKFAWTWVAIHAISQLYIVHSYLTWMEEFYDSIPFDEMGWVSLFTSISSYGSVLMCELTLAAGLALISYQTRTPTKVEVPSAFHEKEV
tara:strand:- start:200 stop:811 length:612 start_codon:yes stop_codon:yes gene_type:complete